MPTYAILGGAHIHTPGFIKMITARDDASVAMVYDHNAERAAARADALNATPTDSPMRALENVDAAIICSETNRHEELLEHVVVAGKPVFIEKPLGLAAADSDRMADAITRAGLLFQTGYFMRGDPKYRWVRQKLSEGFFGDVTRVRGSNCHAGSLKGWFDTDWRWMADAEQAGCGGFGDLGTHMLDILLWLMDVAGGVDRRQGGDVAMATAHVDHATTRYGDIDEYGEGLLSLHRGTLATLAAGWVDIADPLKLLVSGTDATAWVVGGKLFAKTADGSLDGEVTDLPEARPHAFEQFLDAVAGKEAELVPVEEAARVCRVMDAMYRAARQKEWVAVG